MARAENVGSLAAPQPQGKGETQMSEPVTVTGQFTLYLDSPTSIFLEGLRLPRCKAVKTIRRYYRKSRMRGFVRKWQINKPSL